MCIRMQVEGALKLRLFAQAAFTIKKLYISAFLIFKISDVLKYKFIFYSFSIGRK